jgi:hypothetical protein
VGLKKTEIQGSNDDDIRFRCGIGMRTHEILILEVTLRILGSCEEFSWFH